MSDDPRHLDRAWLNAHLERERREADLLGEIREALFGMQDGLVSTLAVVSAVGGATSDRTAVLIAGVASALAGVFSMAAGELLSSRAQREIHVAQIAGEREEVRDRPDEARAEVAELFEREGMTPEDARDVAERIAKYPNSLMRTMVEKELGLGVDEGRGALSGAFVMGGSFGVAALVPIVPYLLLPDGAALAGSIVASGAVTFVIGVVKSRWTKRSPVVSGLEVTGLAAFAGLAGYFFGTLLPGLLGVRV